MAITGLVSIPTEFIVDLLTSNTIPHIIIEWRQYLTQQNRSKSEDKEKIEIDITDDDHEWVERIGKTAYEICNDPSRNRTELNEKHTGFIIESNDAAVLVILVGP